MNNIKNFIDYISQIEAGESAENLYRGNSRESEIRRENLYIYLTLLKKLSPSILLIGEAPGYRGCKLTGIPFTSEKILIEGNCFGILGMDKGYRYINSIERLQTEVSANIVWNELKKLDKPPLIWNIYPFHPFYATNQNKNRHPSSREIKMGKEVLIKLLSMFFIKKIGAIGRISESGIRSLMIDSEIQYIRHPSFGGKNLFQKGLSDLIKAE